MNWDVPPLWKDETVAILAGGPSLTQEQVDYIRDKCRVIVINNSYQLAPWADLLYFCDARWYRWHKDNELFKNFQGIKVTFQNHKYVPDDVLKLGHGGKEGLCLEKDKVATGSNSGFQCINLSFHLGTNRILLLGYDMKTVGGKSHWHNGHGKDFQLTDKTFSSNMVPKFNTLIEPLKSRGVEVINCTPGSMITAFPFQKLENVI
jgi:hypothetical protein